MKGWVDTHLLTVSSGKGGAGAVSFRREKFVPRGGPDGGDGGDGGNILFVPTNRLSSLATLYSKKHIQAQHGQPGSAFKKHGKRGEDTHIYIPTSTLIKDTAGTLIKDLSRHHHQRLPVEDKPYHFLRGGKGGKGNCHFTTSTNQAPQYAQKGLLGQTVTIALEVKLIADIGLLGLPNAGKSTLIRSLTKAKPKVGNYPFTTLIPHLGIALLDAEKTVVLADLPGIIEGAHSGKGLGLQFLRHIERTRFLFYVIDGSSSKPHQDFKTLQKELSTHSQTIPPNLTDRPYAIGISKMELISKDQRHEIETLFSQGGQKEVFFFSSITGEGMDQWKSLLYRVWEGAI